MRTALGTTSSIGPMGLRASYHLRTLYLSAPPKNLTGPNRAQDPLLDKGRYRPESDAETIRIRAFDHVVICHPSSCRGGTNRQSPELDSQLTWPELALVRRVGLPE